MTNSPVWSVILLLIIGLIGVAYVIYYILKEAYLENRKDAKENPHAK